MFLYFRNSDGSRSNLLFLMDVFIYIYIIPILNALYLLILFDNWCKVYGCNCNVYKNSLSLDFCMQFRVKQNHQGHKQSPEKVSHSFIFAPSRFSSRIFSEVTKKFLIRCNSLGYVVLDFWNFDAVCVDLMYFIQFTHISNWFDNFSCEMLFVIYNLVLWIFIDSLLLAYIWIWGLVGGEFEIQLLLQFCSYVNSGWFMYILEPQIVFNSVVIQIVDYILWIE